MKVTCRPRQGAWPPGPAPVHAPFDSPWTLTMSLLQREAQMLGTSYVVIEIDLPEERIRLDGWPKADARPADPGVAVFLAGTSHGDLRYECRRFRQWQDNVRAIALALEALRKVQRYGVGGRGEQYVGWKAIEAATTSTTEAIQVLQPYAHVTEDEAWWENEGALTATYRRAARRTHPDVQDGSDAAFRAVESAYRTLLARAG